MTAPVVRPGILSTDAYVPGERAIDGVPRPVKLSSNESPHGPGPRALEAYRAMAGELFRYPDGTQSELRRVVARVHAVDAARLVFGNGSDEIIQMVTRAYVGAGDEVIVSEHAFLMARTHALAQEARVRTALEPDFKVSVDEILRHLTPLTKLIVIASPNNPCGTYLPRPELYRLHAALPEEVILIVDAAYCEYVSARDYDNGAQLADSAPNVIMTRTFSKLYGLAGLRVGWALASEAIVRAIEHVRSPFNVNAAAQAVAAAACADLEHAAYVHKYNERERERVSRICCELGFRIVPSSANFLLILFDEAPRSAELAHAHLMSRGIIPRPVGGSPPNCLRITIGLESENDAMLRALREFATAG
jgi:histidinol-phosphate aminotransferase